MARRSLAQRSANQLYNSRGDISVDDMGIITQGMGPASDGTLNYAPDLGMEYVEVTKDASQIIILRYYRTLDNEEQGRYRVVREYYVREANESVDDEADSVTDSLDEKIAEDSPDSADSSDIEDDVQFADDSVDTFNGTLNRNDGQSIPLSGRRIWS